MTLTTSSRKRDRSSPEDSDYIPVTKRMNNLHIDVMSVGASDLNDALIGGQMNGLDISSSHHPMMVPMGAHQHQYQCPHRSLVNVTIVNGSNGDYHQNVSIYSPELDSDSNPIYYESNRILFEAHLQRLQRLGAITGHRKSWDHCSDFRIISLISDFNIYYFNYKYSIFDVKMIQKSILKSLKFKWSMI